ncbi:conserved hypothetical protein [Gloeothece citriformis PCC 7424]|uniref:MotA/TolQ/ExbB proton channel domain-containing protein n=1 Tax=Gloeothece citriformis (strain PCC 7424) TaxID=65393 RepID=B7KKC5_GLOC7|nr:hypothetical protein [Gloeothece citriformis]ACK72258.1 conserved hypothetical protein [Gloeothece citriformis PCC 7424]
MNNLLTTSKGIIPIFPSDPLSVVCVWVIIVAAVVLGVIECLAIFNYKKECKSTKEAIDYLLKSKKNEKILKPEGEILLWLFKHLDGQVQNNSFIPKIEQNHFVLLSYPSVLSKPVPRSPVYYAPTLLTALGVLGTFLGIFIGLQGVDLNNMRDAGSLLRASTELLSGMKLAFVTSLWGMSTSILFMFCLAMGGNIRQNHRNNLRKDLSNVAFLNTSERLLSRMNPRTNDEATKDKSASEKSQLTPEAIAEAFKPYLTPVTEDIKAIRELQKVQGSTVELLVQQLRTELIDPVVTQLDQSAQLTAQASDAVRELKDELGEIAQSLAGAVQTIQTFQQDTLIQLQQFATNLQSILAQFRTDTQGVMEQVAVEIKQAVDTSIEGMEAQRTAFKESATQAASTFRGIREDLQQALDTQAQQQEKMLDKVHASTEGILTKAQEAFHNQSETLLTVGKELLV